MIHKHLLFSLILFNFSFENQQKIELDDIQSIKIVDYMDYDFSAKVREYDLKIRNKKALLYDTKYLTSDEYLKKYRQTEINDFSQQIEVYKNIASQKQDVNTNWRLKKYSDSMDLVIKEWYETYLNNRTPKLVKVINNRRLKSLYQLINEPPIDVLTFSKLYCDLPKTMNTVDSSLLDFNLKYCEENYSNSKIIIEIVTKIDTIKFYSYSKNNPPMPWIIERNGQQIETYNHGFNELLYRILPKRPQFNRQRLKTDIDLLVEECCKVQ